VADDKYKRLFVGWSCEVDQSRIALLDEPQAPKNYKDPEKIAEYVNKERVEQQKRLVVTPGGFLFAGIAAVADDGLPVFSAKGSQAGIMLLRFLSERVYGLSLDILSLTLPMPLVYSHHTSVLVPALLYALWQSPQNDPLRLYWRGAADLLDPENQRKLFVDPCEMLVQHLKSGSGGLRFSETALCDILMPEFATPDKQPELIAAKSVRAMCLKMNLCDVVGDVRMAAGPMG
jgi:hypothetical protein